MTFNDIKKHLLISKSILCINSKIKKDERKLRGSFYYPCDVFSFYSEQKDPQSGVIYLNKDYFRIDIPEEKQAKGKNVKFVKLTGKDAGKTFTATIHHAKKPAKGSNQTYYDNERSITIEIDGIIYSSKINLETKTQPYDLYSQARGWRRKDYISQQDLCLLAKKFNNYSLKEALSKDLER